MKDREGPTSSHSSLRTFDLITEGKLMPCLRCPQSNALLPPARLTEVKRRSMVEATNNILGSLEVEVETSLHPKSPYIIVKICIFFMSQGCSMTPVYDFRWSLMLVWLGLRRSSGWYSNFAQSLRLKKKNSWLTFPS